MLFENFDLEKDTSAGRYIKEEIVTVRFADEAGSVASREGANRYAMGDALITGSTGDRWSVSRDRFDAKYEPIAPLLHGQPGAYRNKPIPVWAKQIQAPFRVQRIAGGDVITGNAGDWLMQYAPGDYGIVDNTKFQKVYRLLNR